MSWHQYFELMLRFSFSFVNFSILNSQQSNLGNKEEQNSLYRREEQRSWGWRENKLTHCLIQSQISQVHKQKTRWESSRIKLKKCKLKFWLQLTMSLQCVLQCQNNQPRSDHSMLIELQMKRCWPWTSLKCHIHRHCTFDIKRDEARIIDKY